MLKSKITKLFQNKLVNLYGTSIAYKLLCVLISFLSSILINRCLGVALRGEYTTITTLASLFQLFMNLGIGTAYPAFKRKYPDECKTIFTTLVFFVSVFYLIVLVAIFPVLDSTYRYAVAIAFLMTVENLLVFVAIVEDVSKRNKVNCFTLIVYTLVLILILIFSKHNLKAVLMAVAFNHVLLCSCFVGLFKVSKISTKSLNKKIIFELFSIALPAMFMNLLMYLNYHADVLFLRYLTNDTVSVGLYGTAVTLGNMLWIIPDAFKEILYNRAARKDNPGEVVVAIICNIMLCIAVIIGFVFLGQWFLKTMYGEDFIGSYPLVLMLFVGTIPMIFYKLVHPIYIANGKTKTVVLLLLLAVVSNCIGNVILIPDYKAMGAAISSVISYSVCGVAFLITFIKDYKVSFKDVISNALKIIKK